MKTVGVENLTNNLGVRLDYFESEMISSSGRVGRRLAERQGIKDNDGISPLLHGGGPGYVGVYQNQLIN